MLIEITETKDRYSADVCFNKLDEIYQMVLNSNGYFKNEDGTEEIHIS